MERPIALQQILGVDKKNPHFTICKHPQQSDSLQVYFGAVLLETVEDDREHPSFKLLLARLYNCGVKVKAITEAFAVPYTTLRRWGKALKSGDSEKLMQVLAGRQHPRKLTTEILNFAYQRFKVIYPEENYTYSKRIREEILDVFDVAISGELLRSHFTQWKQSLKVQCIVESEDDPIGPDEQPVLPHKTTESGTAENAGQYKNVRMLGQTASQGQQTGALAENNHKQTVEFVSEEPNNCNDFSTTTQQPEGYQFCHHAGILLFSAFLNRLDAQLDNGGDRIKQWLVMVLLGAVNIEQSKLLNWDALRRLIGDVVANLSQQRQSLGKLAEASSLMALWRINGEYLGINQCNDFYYDPHSKHYTGAHKILKGWCSRLRFAENVLHMDFIHTVLGSPVYIWHDDNFHDLRQRFFEVTAAFRQQFDFTPQKALTFVVDRGIYGLDVFNKIIDEEAENYFVTWEKGYLGDSKADRDWTGSFNLYKGKNSSKDLKQYHFEYYEESWSRNEKLRRIIVRATNPKENTIEVSILSN